MLKTLLIIPSLLCCIFSFATIQDDSTSTAQTNYIHITKRAPIFSALIPGAGQIYNEIGYRKVSNKKHRAWWKVPLIYGGLGACGYYFYQNNKFAALLKKEYLFQEQNPGAILDQRFANYSFEALINGYDDENDVRQRGFNEYARNRDILVFGFIGVWALNVIEAYVDAHFVSFDVSEDLSLSWRPTIIGYQNPGVSLQLNFN